MLYQRISSSHVTIAALTFPMTLEGYQGHNVGEHKGTRKTELHPIETNSAQLPMQFASSQAKAEKLLHEPMRTTTEL